ncbi:hypothetical protein M8494_27575 [Serratia ureilytica]
MMKIYRWNDRTAGAADVTGLRQSVLRPTVGQGSTYKLQPFAVPAQRHGVAKAALNAPCGVSCSSAAPSA